MRRKVNRIDTYDDRDEGRHLDSMEVMVLANKAYIRGQLIQIGKVSLIDPIIVQAEKHMRQCIECKKKVKKPQIPIKIPKSDWLSLLSDQS